MKSNRQKTSLRAGYPHLRSQPQATCIPSLLALIEQVDQYEYTLTCCKELSLNTVSKQQQQSIRVDVCTQMPSNNVLYQCLQELLISNNPKEYVFCASNHGYSHQNHPMTQPFQPSTSRRNNPQRTSIHFSKSSLQKQETPRQHIFGQISDRLIKERPAPERGQAHQIESEGMFTVEQIKESHVQGSVSLLNQEPEVDFGIEGAQPTTVDKNMETFTPKESHNNHQSSNLLQHNNKENQHSNSQSLFQSVKESNMESEAPIVQIQESNQQNPPLLGVRASYQQPCQEDSKFSFAQIMKQGVIQPQQEPSIRSSKMIQLRLVGDSQLESARKRVPCHELTANQLSSMSELSSILSEGMKGVASGVKRDGDKDSLKGDIEEIDRCFEKAETQRVKIQLGSLAEKHEQKLQECVNIEERPSLIAASGKKGVSPEYVVRYNVRMLQKREQSKYQTSVIRVSPLKFRKKQEMVQELIRHRVVEKESESIKYSDK